MTDLSGPPPLPAASAPLVVPLTAKAAWWCWPLIAFALFPFAWFESAPPADEESPSGSYDPSDLAILKMQGQVVIATSKLEPKAAGEAFEDLSGHASDSHSLAALALLESFVQPDSPRLEPLLERFSDEDPSDLAEITRTAVREGIDEATRGQLRDRLGWFADLARSPGLASPPQDEAIRLRSYLVLGSMGVLFTAVLLGIIAGAILLFLHLRRVKADPGVNAFDATVGPAGVLFECFALYLGIMTVGSLLGTYLYGMISPISYGLAVIVPLLWPRFRGVRWEEFRAAVGLHRGKGWGKEILAGMVGYLGVLAIASVGISLTLLLTLVAGYFQGEGGAILPGGGPGTGGNPPIGPESHPLVGWIYEGNFWTRVSCLALAAGFAPLFEELFFRGALHRYFRSRYRFAASAVFTGLIFAALHPQGFFAIPALAGIGIGFSLLREWRDSLVAPIVAHAINNGTLVLMLWWVL